MTNNFNLFVSQPIKVETNFDRSSVSKGSTFKDNKVEIYVVLVSSCIPTSHLKSLVDDGQMNHNNRHNSVHLSNMDLVRNSDHPNKVVLNDVLRKAVMDPYLNDVNESDTVFVLPSDEQETYVLVTFREVLIVLGVHQLNSGGEV